jgi:hypothetical protein
VTNVRDGREQPLPEWRSRGELVDEFVKGGAAPSDWLAELSLRAADYGPFNLLVAAGGRTALRQQPPRYRHRPLKPGLHALSNGDLDAPWPKVSRLREVLSSWIETEASMDDWPPVQKLVFRARRHARGPGRAAARYRRRHRPGAPAVRRLHQRRRVRHARRAVCCCSTTRKPCSTSAASAATATSEGENILRIPLRAQPRPKPAIIAA